MAEVTTREELHKLGKELWLESDRKNSLILGTGTGKSKVAIDILKQLFLDETLCYSSKILLLTNSTDLRDNNWKAEFVKWDALDIWDVITSECYQTVYKWGNTQWDLVISDEIDFALTEVYGTFFQNNECDMILGLTGFVDESKQVLLNTVAPVLMEYSTQDAQDAGILNSTQVVFVRYNLSTEKTKEVKYKDKVTGQEKTFKQSESEAYEYIETQCNISWGQMQKLQKELENADAFSASTSVIRQDLGKARMKNRRATTDRKKLLFSGVASCIVAKALREKILASPNNKLLTFSMRTEQGAKISSNTYNGTNKKDNTALTDLSAGTIRDLAVCKAIDRGTNLVGVNNEVFESYEGSETSFNQRHGRGCRLLPDQKMYLYIMLPYYFKKVKNAEGSGYGYKQEPTQMVKWAENMLASFKLVNPITITYDEGSNSFISN